MRKGAVVVLVAAIFLHRGTECPVASASAQSKAPRPDHIVIVIEENKDYGQIVGSPIAPYLNSLIAQGALLTHSYALHHPSQPNYLEFFSGDRQGVFDDTCQPQFSAPNLASNLLKNNLRFAGYAEDLPANHQVCTQGLYAKKHCPWLDFTDVPDSVSLDASDFPIDDAGFTNLPTVALVIPNLMHDMHFVPSVSKTIAQQVRNGDAWLKRKFEGYVKWAKTHNSLFIVTWDEDNATYMLPKNETQQITTTPPRNHIATILVGAMIKPGATSSQRYTHYDLLRTIEDMYGLPLLGGSQHAKDIADIWK